MRNNRQEMSHEKNDRYNFFQWFIIMFNEKSSIWATYSIDMLDCSHLWPRHSGTIWVPCDAEWWNINTFAIPQCLTCVDVMSGAIHVLISQMSTGPTRNKRGQTLESTAVYNNSLRQNSHSRRETFVIDLNIPCNRSRIMAGELMKWDIQFASSFFFRQIRQTNEHIAELISFKWHLPGIQDHFSPLWCEVFVLIRYSLQIGVLRPGAGRVASHRRKSSYQSATNVSGEDFCADCHSKCSAIVATATQLATCM